MSHDRIYVEQKESIGGQILLNAKTNSYRICASDRFCRVQNLPTSSVELIWPTTERYFQQILSTDFMNRFYLRRFTRCTAVQKQGLKAASRE